MADAKNLLLRSNLKQLRLPVMGAEFEKLAREAAAANESYEQFLLRLTELEVAARSSNAVQARIRLAGFPVSKDFDTFDFSAVPALNKPKVLELARGEWIEQKSNVCFIGSPGTGKTHLATALGLAACRGGGAEAVSARQGADADGQGGPADLRRTGLPVVQPVGSGTAVPTVGRPLRAAEPAADEQPGVRRVGHGVPGGAHDSGVVGSADTPLCDLRDEWRKLPLPGVDEGEEEQEGRGEPTREDLAEQSAKSVFEA